MLEFRGVSVTFGHGARSLQAVAGVDLAIPDGTIVGLVGESGSGKSTLAKAAVGLVGVAEGSILLDGLNLSQASPSQRKKVQMVFQDPLSSLDPRMTVGASIAEALLGSGTRQRRRQEVLRLLDLVGLPARLHDQLPRALSGGQRQRVALARSLGSAPAVLIADEITSALDVSVQGSILNLIRDIQDELGMSLLFISHNLSIVRYVADMIAVMYLGELVEVAPTVEVVARPRHPYTRMLLDSAPRLGTRLPLEDDQTGLDEEPADPHEPPAGCRFHPRCPIGPLVHPERQICIESSPQTAAASRSHAAACHFAPVAHEITRVTAEA